MRKLVESTLKESQEENDDLRRRILGLETQLKEYYHFADSWQDVETRLKEKIFKLEVLEGEAVNFSVSTLSRWCSICRPRSDEGVSCPDDLQIQF